MKRDLVERALLPLFRLRQPENPSLGIMRRAFSADQFLAANFDQLLHELHSRGVKPSCRNILAESGRKCVSKGRAGKWQNPSAALRALRCNKPDAVAPARNG